MTIFTDEHPLDQTLITYSLEGGDEELREHVSTCPSCARFVKEVGAIGRVIRQLPEIPAPSSVRQGILRSVKKGRLPGFGDWLSFDCATWYKNPLFIGLGLLGLVVFLYIFFVFVL